MENLEKFVINQLGIRNIEYFYTARNIINEKKIKERSTYDKYWISEKTFPKMNLNNIDIIKGNAESFLDYKNNTLQKLHIIKEDNSSEIIEAKDYILANHTPGILSLLEKTRKKLGNDIINPDTLGLGFSEHPQLSFGAIILDKNIKFYRTLPTNTIFSDFIENNKKFRIEYHLAPPLQNKIGLHTK